MKIRTKDAAVLIAVTVVATISLIVRDTAAQRMWHLCSTAGGVCTGYILFKRLGRGMREFLLLYSTVALLSVVSFLLGGDTFTHGRWLITPVVNLYIPGLFPLSAPLVVWLKEQKKLLLAACAWGGLVLISLLMQSVDGLILCGGVLAMLIWGKKAIRITVLFLITTLLGSLILHHFNSGRAMLLYGYNYDVTDVLYMLGIIPFVALAAALGIILSGLSDAGNPNLRNIFMIFIVARVAVHYICMAIQLETGLLINLTELPLMGHATAVFTDHAILVWALLTAHTKEEPFLLKDDHV